MDLGEWTGQTTPRSRASPSLASPRGGEWSNEALARDGVRSNVLTMKKLIKLALFVLIVVLAVPVVMYGSVRPCGMLKKELIAQAKDRIEDASDAGQEQARELGGEEAERIAESVGAVVESTLEGMSEGLVEARVDRMSLRECVSELWRIKTE